MIRFRKNMFTPEIQLELGEFIDAGCSRNVYHTDYKDDDGRTYVVKEAADGDGLIHNRGEWATYKAALLCGQDKWLPKMKAISANGKYLLVEECTTANDYFPLDSEDEIAAYFDAQFETCPIPYNDMHERNWGYTVMDDRPVILDIMMAFYKEEYISAQQEMAA